MLYLMLLIVYAIYVVISPRKTNLRTMRPRQQWRESLNMFPGIRLWRGCFTGSWQPQCSCFCLMISFRRGCPVSLSNPSWDCGAVLTSPLLSFIYFIHASFWLDFWSIWPEVIATSPTHGESEANLPRDPNIATQKGLKTG